MGVSRFFSKDTALSGARRRVVGATALAVCLGAVPLGLARADERDDAVAQQQQAQQQQAQVEASLEGVSSQLGQAYLDLQAAEQALGTAQNDLDSAEQTLATKEREQQLADDRLAVANADLEEIAKEAQESETAAQENQESVGQLVVSSYQGDSSLTSWSYVLESQDVTDLMERASTVEIASGLQEGAIAAAEAQRAQDANRKARQDATTARVSSLKADADTAEAAASSARDTAQTKRDEVSSLKTDKEAAASVLESQKGDLEAQLEQVAADEAAAAATIAAIDAKNQQAVGYGGGSVDVSALGSGAIGHPITGALSITSPYGYRTNPYTGVYKLHAGVDLMASQGVPQYAAVSGAVTYNQNDSCGNGMFVNGGVINGQSVVLAYCHLSGYSVSDGASVSKGEQIGLTGMTGGATGPHVHFEVYLNGQTVDPMTLPGF